MGGGGQEEASLQDESRLLLTLDASWRDSCGEQRKCEMGVSQCLLHGEGRCAKVHTDRKQPHGDKS